MNGPAKYKWQRGLQEKQRLNGYVFSEASLVSKLLSAYLKKNWQLFQKRKKRPGQKHFSLCPLRGAQATDNNQGPLIVFGKGRQFLWAQGTFKER